MTNQANHVRTSALISLCTAFICSSGFITPIQAGNQPAMWKQTKSGRWYLQLADGSCPVSCWFEVDQQIYRFDGQGLMVTGWFRDAQNRWYLLDSNGRLCRSAAAGGGWIDASGLWHAPGWMKCENRWQYLKADGRIFSGGWQKISNRWYRFDEDGYMETGIVYEGKDEYFLQEDGSMATLLWRNGKFYGPDGARIREAETEDDGSQNQPHFVFSKEQAKKLQEKGSLGFYESVGTPDALQAAKIIRTPAAKLKNTTHYQDPLDACSLANMRLALNKLLEYSRLRQKEGLPEQKVTHELMAIAQVQTNCSADYAIGHTQAYFVAENLAWTRQEPYQLWYYRQKQNLMAENGPHGHYDNILKSYTHTGLAVSQKGDLRTWDGRTQPVPAWGQVFQYRQYGMHIQDYVRLFDAYEQAISQALSGR